MKDRNIITPIIFSVFILFIVSFGTFSITIEFDLVIFAISLSFSIIGLCLDFNAYTISENSSDVMKEKMKLYHMIDGKKSQLTAVRNSILSSHNENIVSDIYIYSCHVMGKNYYNKLENMIKEKILIEELHKSKLEKQYLKTIKKLLKSYNNIDYIEEILREYETKELINKKNINIAASLISVISFIFSIFAFFKIDYQSINLTPKLIIITIVFAINVFGTFESYWRVKKYLIDYYILIQRTIKAETVNI